MKIVEILMGNVRTIIFIYVVFTCEFRTNHFFYSNIELAWGVLWKTEFVIQEFSILFSGLNSIIFA